MSVTSALITIEDFENNPTYVGYGGGPGASDETDQVIENITAGSRKVDNAVNKGFTVSFASLDLSNAHVKLWISHIHWTLVTNFRIKVVDGSAANDDHTIPTADYPLPLGGWIPVFLDIERTAESSGPVVSTDITELGAICDVPDVAGVANNLVIDKIMYGTAGLLWSGSNGSMQDFIDYEETNSEGNLVNIKGINFVYSRLQIGDSSATTFTDSGFTVTFPDVGLCASDFMGVTIDLQNASSEVILSGCTFQSGDPAGASTRPDFLVTSISGVFSLTNAFLSGIRIVNLNSKCTLQTVIISNCGLIDSTNAGSTGASMIGCFILLSKAVTNASALRWDINENPIIKLADQIYSKGVNAHHAIEFGLNSPLTMTMTNVTLIGFNVSNGNDDSTFHVKRTTGTVTINIVGGTGNVSYKTDGATVIIVEDQVTHSLTGLVNNSEVTYVQRGAAIDTGADGATTTGSRNFVTGNSWSTDEHKGFLLEITSGADLGRYYVSGNNATTLFLDTEMGATAGTLNWELYDENDDTELFHVENVTGNQTDFTYTHVSDEEVDILVHEQNYESINVTKVILGNTSVTFPINQISDNNYFNP